MVKINRGSIEPDQHSLSLLYCVGRWKASWILEETGSSSDLGDMCLVSLATDRGEISFVRDGCRKA
jgi:hypothetical protein